MRADLQLLAEPLEVLIEVKDVDPGTLSGDGHGEIGEREAMGAVGALRGQISHRRQDGALHRAIDRDLAQPLHRAFDRRDPPGSV